MPSTISDFSKNINKMHPNFRVADDNLEKEYNPNKNNRYKRAVTIDNTGKTVKSNYNVCVVWNTLTFFRENKITPTFNDLRVYDEDGTTPLSFSVESPATSHTAVFVRIPNLPARSYTVYFEYGNPSLASFALEAPPGSVVLGPASTTPPNYWLKTNESQRFIGTYLPSSIWWLKNQQNNFKSPFDQVGDKPFLFSGGVLNNLPVLNSVGDSYASTGVSAGEYPWHTPAIGTSQCTIFIVTKASTQANYQSLVRYQKTGTGACIYPFTSGGTASFYVDNGASATINAGLVNNSWNIASAHFTKNTSMRTYRNGALVASITAPNVDLPLTQLTIGASFNKTAFFTGDFADVIILPYDLNDLQRQNVENYLNTKYRVYNTADMPTYSVGVETPAGKPGFDFISYAPVSSWTRNEKIENVGEASQDFADVEIINIFTKNYLAGNGLENFDTSVLNSESVLNTYQCRELNISTTAVTDAVTVERIEGVVNVNDLSTYRVSNMIETTTYDVLPSDYFVFSFLCEDHTTLDLVNSKIRFENAGGTLIFESDFTNNLNLLESNKLINLRFLVGDFTKTGAGDWSDVTIQKLIFQTASGTQKVFYSDFKIQKDFENDNNFNNLNAVNLGVGVSSDNDNTYFNLNINNFRIQEKIPFGNDLSLNLQSYYETIKNKTFSELPSFPGFQKIDNFNPTKRVNNQYLLLQSLTEGGVSAKFEGWYNFYMEKILSLIFPKDFYDVDLTLATEDIEFNGSPFGNTYIPISDYIFIKGNEKIGDKIEKILQATAGVLSFDSVNNKIIVKNAYKIFDNVPSYYEISNIFDYKIDTSSKTGIVNFMQVDGLKFTGVNGAVGSSFLPLQPRFSFGGAGLYQLKANTSQNIVIPIENLTGVDSDFLFTLDNFIISGWSFSADQFTLSPSNAGVTLENAYIQDDKLFLTYRNTNLTPRFLYAFGGLHDYFFFEDVATLDGFTTVENGKITATLQNSSSVESLGIYDYALDARYAWVKMPASTIYTPDFEFEFAGYYQKLVDNFDKLNLVLITCKFDPNLQIGKPVKIRDNLGAEKRGFILAIKTYCQVENYSQQVLIRLL